MKYSIEVIEKAMWKHCDSMNPVDDTLAELIKPEWKPAVGQVYYAATAGFRIETGKVTNLIPDRQPLTTKQAGKEPMKHLVDALEWYKQSNAGNRAKAALANHAELMK